MGSPPDQLLQPKDSALDAWLRMCVVVLDAVQQLAQAPVGVRLRADHHLQPVVLDSRLRARVAGASWRMDMA